LLSIIILLIVFVLIAVRRVGFIRFRIWQIMLLGAIGVLVTGEISPLAAVRAINTDVILFLFGVFVLGRALEESGYLAYLASRFFGKARTFNALVLFVLFGAGLFSALLMNDTLAIIGTPVVLALAVRTNTQPKILLLALAFAVTIGSVTSPIGNPQNLLVAIHGNISNPFITFSRYLFVPTIINLGLAYLLLRLFYKGHFQNGLFSRQVDPIADAGLARVARLSLILLVAMVIVKVVIVFLGLQIDFKLTYIALVSALPVLLFSRRRIEIVRRIDWSTLVFFAAMFVLTASVWDSGYFQGAMSRIGVNPASGGQIMIISVILSQFISNVPLVALYLPVLNGIGSSAENMMALAAGSTIAGNLTILGAASNVIIIQNAEKTDGVTLTFWDFFRIGLPLTVINTAVYWLFLTLLK
jgi:Na+/H+ antiporter NhaD/arsenite permease-like protein